LSAHQVDNIDHLAASIHEDFDVPSVPVVDNNHANRSIRDLPLRWFVDPNSNADNPIPIGKLLGKVSLGGLDGRALFRLFQWADRWPKRFG